MEGSGKEKAATRQMRIQSGSKAKSRLEAAQRAEGVRKIRTNRYTNSFATSELIKLHRKGVLDENCFERSPQGAPEREKLSVVKLLYVTLTLCLPPSHQKGTGFTWPETRVGGDGIHAYYSLHPIADRRSLYPSCRRIYTLLDTHTDHLAVRGVTAHPATRSAAPTRRRVCVPFDPQSIKSCVSSPRNR